jgi:triosephosphate isomerase
MRKKIVAGNWKMNLNLQEGVDLVAQIIDGLPKLDEQHQVVIAPPATHLTAVYHTVEDTDYVSMAAQNCSDKESGAYTGEVSANMVWSTGAQYVILGHSERREYFSENNELLARKTNAALAAGLNVIFCCGEPLEIRDADMQNSYVEQQINEGLFHLEAEALEYVVLAYEPIWAIGTGRTASAQQAQEMHAHIRSIIAGKYGTKAADSMTILYGGSCKPSNAPELFARADVDGGLIGGASLKANEFLGIISAMMQQ